MRVVRIIEPDRVRPLQVVLGCLVALTVAGSCLLTSGPNSRIEGSRDWEEESPLRAIVSVLNLSYTQTTAQGIEIKGLVFGIGAALAVGACGVALLMRSPTGEDVSPEDATIEAIEGGTTGRGLGRRQIGPLVGAQVLMGAYVLWSFVSVNSHWSSAPDLALGGSVFLAIGVVWALALGRGMNRPVAAAAAGALVAVCALTAIAAIAYYGERNPTRRASYPIGNPLFLAACLIPGILLSVSFGVGSVRDVARRPAMMVVSLVSVLGLVVISWAFYLTSARAASIGIAVGLAMIVWLAVPRRRRVPVALAFAVIGVAGIAYLWPQFTAPSDTGRDASLRLRHYAWWYAVDMIEESPIIGQGQGAYTQFGDAPASEDVLDDPSALESRIAHAHNEWLEVGADLGAVGLTLVVGSLVLTFWAGIRALPTMPNSLWRWALVGLLGSLGAMVVEESADVALRVVGFPTVFYTTLGLVWALSRSSEGGSTRGVPLGPLGRVVGGVGSLLVGAGLLWASMGDFNAARAYHDTADALQNRAFDRAVTLAERSAAGRLSPQRRLEALERLCSTHLYIARSFQTTSVDRYARAHQSDPPDAHLLQLASADREVAQEHIEAARAALESLVRRSPTYFGAGWLEYRLNQLLNVFARVDGDELLASRATTGAALALERELKRSPYDALIAVSFIEVARDRMSLAQVLDVLARPLRREPMPPDYGRFLSRLTEGADFDAAFAPIWSTITQSPPDALRDDSLAPEKLRLAALIRFGGEDYARALDTVVMAAAMYELLPTSAAIGAASCLMECAEYQFFADPGKSEASLAFSERALRVLPDSTPGRQLASQLRSRMVLYHLAIGSEDSAFELLGALMPEANDVVKNAELGRSYTSLCSIFVHRSRGELPRRFERWVTRAMELRPRDELVWRFAAQVAFDQRRFGDSVKHLRHALELGADPAAVMNFVQLAMGTDAGEYTGFRTLAAELRSVLSEASAPMNAANRSLNSSTGP